MLSYAEPPRGRAFSTRLQRHLIALDTAGLPSPPNGDRWPQPLEATDCYASTSIKTGMVSPRLSTLNATLVLNRFTFGFSVTIRAMSAS